MTAILVVDPVVTWGDAAFDGYCGAVQDSWQLRHPVLRGSVC